MLVINMHQVLPRRGSNVLNYLAGMSVFMAFFVLLLIFEANTTASGNVPILGKCLLQETVSLEVYGDGLV